MSKSIRIVESWIRAFNARNPIEMFGHYSPAAVNIGFVTGLPSMGPLQIRDELVEHFRAFPDAWMVAEKIRAKGDLVSWEVKCGGTFMNPFKGHMPTGRPYQVGGCGFVHLEGDKISMQRGPWNQAAIFSQLGIFRGQGINSGMFGSPDATFKFGELVGRGLAGGEVVLLKGSMGAGKTLLAKGILSGLRFDTDEVTSPSFSLQNIYETSRFNVHHIDLWRIENTDETLFAVNLDEILEERTAVTIIEWADKLPERKFNRRTIEISIDGDGDEPRKISIHDS